MPRLRRMLVIAALACLSQACAVISYDIEPGWAWEALEAHQGELKKPRYEEPLYVHVGKVPNITLGGASALNDAVEFNGHFEVVERREEPPPQGLYLDVRISARDPNPATLIWGYCSLSTYLLFPTYTGDGGFDVFFTVYVDGEEREVFEYRIDRKAFVGALAFPVLWVNALTPSEGEAFAAVTALFFEEAESADVFRRSDAVAQRALRLHGRSSSAMTVRPGAQ